MSFLLVCDFQQATIENGCLTKASFSNVWLWKERCRKKKFYKKLIKSRLIALQPERIIWCYAKHKQDLFEELMKMNVEYGQDIPGELDKHFKKNKRNLEYWMILWMKHQRALKLLSCLHLVVMAIFSWSILHICSIKINALFILIWIT